VQRSDPSEADLHATDIHAYLPRLNKKGVLFKPSATTIAQRSSEYHALVNALLGDDLPLALCKLRDDRLVHDFFGYWRRDYDQAVKSGAPPPIVIDYISADEPTDQKGTIRMSLDRRIPMPRATSSEWSSDGPPSLTSGESSDVPFGSPLSTPITDGWTNALRKATYPPGYVPSLISQEQSSRGSGQYSREHKQKAQEQPELAVYVETNHELFQDQSSEPTYHPLPSTTNTIEQPSSSPWAPLRMRQRSTLDAPTELVAGPGTASAKIMVVPSSGLPGPSSPAVSTGPPAPPPSARRRAATAVSSQGGQSPVYGKTHSGGTFGSIEATQAVRLSRSSELIVSPDQRPMSATSVGMSVMSGSQGASEISSVHIAQCIPGRISKVPPQVVWIQRQPSAKADTPLSHAQSFPIDLVPDDVLSSESEDEEDVEVPSAAIDIRKSQLDALLEMDVSQRWWRSKVAAPPAESEGGDDDDDDDQNPYDGFESTSILLESPPVFVPASHLPPALEAPAHDRSRGPSPLHAPNQNASPFAKPQPLPILTTTAQAPPGVSSGPRYQPPPQSSYGQGGVSLTRASSVTSYAYSIERMPRSHPQHIKQWAAHVPSGISEEEPLPLETYVVSGLLPHLAR
jgi:hypothetical protein